MKIFSKMSTILLAVALGATATGVTSCNSGGDFDTYQYGSVDVTLNVFGPSPVARGGELRFLGTNLDQVTAVEIPGAAEITDIKVVDKDEIRVTVPQDAQVGKVTLVYPEGTITTKTLLTYTEPISIESFSPTTIKPGQELTIKGEYLNLIHEVIFAEEVVVPEKDFTAHSRSEIKLIVPAEAQTGKFIVSDAAPQIPNWIYSDEELTVILPSVEAPLDLTKAKPGDEVTAAGKDLDLVTNIYAPNGDEIEFTYKDGTIKFTLPENISDGTIVMAPASGVKVALANIGVVVPTELEAVPAEGLRAGDELVIKGVNMQMVSSLSFVNVSGTVEPKQVSATEVRVDWPEMAQSGDVVLNLKSGKTVSVEVKVAYPEVSNINPNPVAAAAQFTLSGKNLDLVKSVTFAGDITVDVENATKRKITLIAPPTAKSGALVLHMANGESVETDVLTIDAPQCAFVTETLTEEPHGADLLIVKIENADKLTSVLVNGESVQYILNGNTLYILLPQTASTGTTVTLVSSNGEISYTYDCIPATHIENVIWSGAWECANWNGNQDLAYGAFDWASIPVGATLTFYMTPTVPAGEWWCISLRHGDGWANIPCLPGQYDMPADGILEVEYTQELKDDLVNNMGMIIMGTGYILTKITASWEISLETDVLLDLPIVLSSWENHEVGPGLAFVDAGIKLGQTLRFYCDITGDDPCIQIFDGHWNAWTWDELGGTQQFNSGNTPDFKCIELKVNQDVYDRLTTFTDWGYCIIFQGQAITIKRVTLE